MNTTLLISAIAIGAIVSAFTGGVLANYMYDNFQRRPVLHITMAAFAALVGGYGGFTYFGATGLLLGVAGVGIGILSAKVYVAVNNATEFWGDPQALSSSFAKSQEESNRNFLIRGSVVLNGLIGGFTTHFLVQGIGASGLIVAGVGSTITMILLSGFVLWFGFAIMVAVSGFMKLCQFASATASKLTERV